MKKTYLLILLLMLAVSSLYGQRRRGTIIWFNITPKAGFGTSLFLNPNVFADGEVLMNGFNASYFYGGYLGFDINQSFELGADLTMGSFQQRYEDMLALNGNRYSKTIKYETKDVGFLFRYTSEYGGYFEIGPKFTTVNKIDITHPHEAQDGMTDATKEAQPHYDPFDDYNDRLTSLTIGFGKDVSPNTNYLRVNIGGRINYTFTNIMKNTQDGIGGNDYPMNDGIFDIDYSQKYSTYKTTTPLSAYLVLEVKYYFGYFGTASCGRPGLRFFEHR